MLVIDINKFITAYLVDKTSLVVESDPLIIPVRERYLLFAVPHQSRVVFVQKATDLLTDGA